MTVPITMGRPSRHAALDEEGAGNYYRSMPRKAFLQREVIDLFEEAIKESAGFSSDNLPAAETKTVIRAGEYGFEVVSNRAEKKPELADVFEYAGGFIGGKIAEYQRGERPRGILTVRDAPYMAVKLFMDAVQEKREDVKKVGLRQSMSVPEALQAMQVPESLAVPVGTNLTRPTAANAHLYGLALVLAGEYGEVIDEFERRLIETTGYSSDSLPEESVTVWYQIGSHHFKIPNIPYPSTSYAKALDGLLKEPGKKKPENAGDLMALSLGIGKPGLDRYCAVKRDGDVYVSMEALKNRLYELKEEHTETKLRQRPIHHYPLF